VFPPGLHAPSQTYIPDYTRKLLADQVESGRGIGNQEHSFGIRGRALILLILEQVGQQPTSIPVARIARVMAVGLPHHITQEGMGGEPFSMQRKNRTVYLQLLRE
jgi:hypothetical protein